MYDGIIHLAGGGTNTQGGGGHCGIGLVEVMWKVVTVIINRCLTNSIAFQDILLGFRSGCGTGTASLKVKLIQQLSEKREEVLYEIFLDLKKVYVSMEREICLDIL